MNRKVTESLGLAVLALFTLGLWLIAFRQIFAGWHIWDDPHFMAIAPVAGTDLSTWISTGADESGYYRPFSLLLWSWTSALGLKTFTHFQFVSISLLLGASIFLYLGLSKLFGNRPLSLAAASAFALNGAHLKPLMWITLWFHEASCFFAAANFALMILHAENGSPWLRRISLATLFFTYATNNAMHSWALVPLAIDFIYSRREEKEAISAWVKRWLWRSKDHLVLGLVLFAYIYLMHAPLERQSGSIHSLAENFTSVKAFALYVAASIAHPWGDSRAYSPYPLWLITLTSLTILISLFGYFFDRRLLIGTAALFGAGIVISMLKRWQMEYALPMALGGAILFCGTACGLVKRMPYAAWLLAPAWIFGAFYVSGTLMAPNFIPWYLADSQVSRHFVDSIKKISSEEKPGRVFVISKVHGERMKSASNAHFAWAAIPYFIPGRAVFLDHKLFLTGGLMGSLEITNPWAQRILRTAQPPLRLSCGDSGCARTEFPR